MRIPARLVCILIVLLAFTAGCGGDDDNDTSATTRFQPSATTAVSGGPTSAPTPTSAVAGVVQGVVDGAACSPQGARGVTKDGLAMLCSTAGAELRWRPA